MNEVEENPYSAPSTSLSVSPPRRRAILDRIPLTLFFTLIFTLSFFFLGASIGAGLLFALRYTHQMIFDFPELVLTMVLSYAALRLLILPSICLKHLWIPVLSGIASYHAFPLYWGYCDTLIQTSLSPEWTDLIHESLMGGVPAFVAIGIESSHAMLSTVIRRKRMGPHNSHGIDFVHADG